MDVGREVAPNLVDDVRAAEEVVVRGATGLGATGAAAAGEGTRPMMGGVAMRGVPGCDGFGVEGLDQDSKKSSSVCSLGGAGASTPSMTIP